MSDLSDSEFLLYKGLVCNDFSGGAQADTAIDAKIELLTKFKGHVKKELINVPSIPSYFTSLFHVLDKCSLKDPSSNGKLLVLAHSSLCYLVKRVAMQTPNYYKDPRFIKDLLLHLFLLNTTENPLQSKNFWATAVRALEAIYLVQPLLLQKCLQDLLYDLVDKQKILLVVDEFLQMNKKNNNNFDNDNLLVEFFNSKFLEDLTAAAGNDQVNKLILDILRKNFSDDDQLKNFSRQLNGGSNCFKVPIFDIDRELNIIAKEYQIYDNIGNDTVPNHANKADFNSMEDVSSFLEDILLPFQSPKETEQNWKIRQSNLIELRTLFRDNSFILDNQLPFLSICKDLQMIECIGKAVLSLRTTLSMTACHVIKVFLQSFHHNLDLTLLDQIFTVLKSLLLTAKKISSTAAFNCLILMFITIGFHSKLFQNCLMLINEKSVSPKNCSAVLLRIFLIKFTDSKKLDHSLIYIEEWLKKGITDAQTCVRESMRLTFWYYYKSYPSSAKNFLQSQFSLQLKKAIELSIPHHLQINYHPVSSSLHSSSSTEISNKASHQFRKFPSYAKPTHSSNAFLQRTSNHRSASEYILNELDSSSHNSLKRKISAPPLTLTMKRSIPSNGDKLPNSEDNETENSIQIDLTDDISNGHSNSLITKYLGKERQQVDDLESMYLNLESSIPAKVKAGLQTLEKRLLIKKPTNFDQYKETVDFDRLTLAIKSIMIKTPSDLKPLLAISQFCRLIPLSYLIEIHAVNSLDFNEESLKCIPSDKFLETIKNLIDWLNSNSFERQENDSIPEMSLHYMKYKQNIFDFCFQLLVRILQIENKASVSHEQITNCIMALISIWGQEFNERFYFDSLYGLFVFNCEVFKNAIESVDSVSTRFKICDELGLRSSGTVLHTLDDIRNRPVPSGRTGDFDTDNKLHDVNEENELVDDRKYMEMTMVNPFTQNRSTSGGSVIHHDPQSDRDHTMEGDIQKEDRLSEMTKVVSVYEQPRSQCLTTTNIDQESDVEMCQQRDVNLNEIFGHSVDQEHTVKFSSKSPNIINPSTRSSSASTPGRMNEEENSINRNTSRERDKSPVTPLNDHEANILTQGINSIEIGQRHEVVKDTSLPPNSSSDLLVNAIQQTMNSVDILNSSEFLGKVSPDSLTYYELSQGLTMLYETNPPENHYKHMMKALTRVKNGSFTIKHLNDLTAPLLNFPQHEKLRTWLEAEKGYDELLELSNVLLNSADETYSIPMNMASKCIVLIECLVLLNNSLHNVAPLSSAVFKDIWRHAVEMVGKLSDYSNEIYILLQELRDLLNEAQFFSSNDITAIVSLLATQTQESGPKIKETFLMETLSTVILKNAFLLKKHQFPEIIQMMQYFFDSDSTEWRCVSSGVLSNVLRHLRSQDASFDETQRLFSSLSSWQFHIVDFLASQ